MPKVHKIFMKFLLDVEFKSFVFDIQGQFVSFNSGIFHICLLGCGFEGVMD